MQNAKVMAVTLGLASVLAAHPVMAQNVFAGSNWNSFHLASTGNGLLGVRLLLPPGTYVINGKVSVHNLDSDPQPAVCRLMVESPFPGSPQGVFALDRTEVRMDHRDGGDTQSVTLQGVATFAGNPLKVVNSQVSLACVSPNANGSDWVIAAIQTTGTFNVPPCTSALSCSTYTFPPP
jgi:hypothetical protein